MNEREKHDEAFWNDLLEEIDLEVGDLAAAEARMSAAEAEELAPGQAEKMVRHATHGVPVLRLREPKAQTWTKAAAVLLGSALLTAATVFLVWSAGRNSKDTMSYEQQIELLARADQPDKHRQTAIAWVSARVGRAIVTLQAVRDNADAAPELVSGARTGLSWIGTLVSVEPPPLPQTPYAALDDAIAAALNAGLGTEARLQALGRIIDAAAGDVSALRSIVGPSVELREDLQVQLGNLRWWLRK